ncbi:flavin reductase [Candidatus Woesearchaeota archaeon]|nr:flavin reductase [Candidatus Woesearchaeota archaeon]
MRTLLGPQQTILVTTRGKTQIYGKEKIIDNVIPVDWHMPCSIEHFMYAIAINKKTFTHQLIKESNIFVINFIPDTMKDAAVFCGRHSGLHVDKFKEAKLFKLNASAMDCCKIAGALGYLECEVVHEVACEDHTIFVAKVIHKEEKAEAKRLFHIFDNEFTTTSS